jgi:uncharacterized Zn ribbon protein
VEGRFSWWTRIAARAGNRLRSGYTPELVKGSSITLKMGTKVKSIRLANGDHEGDCKTDAGNFMLKACYLKKV